MRTRILLSVIIIGLGLTAAVLPDRENHYRELNEVEMLQEMLSASNYISVEELAHALISKDPSVRIIDLRPADAFKDNIPGALNVPVDSVFSENYLYLFDQDISRNILYGENESAAQVWTVLKQLGYKNNYLLKGGLAAWEKDILNPTRPSNSASQGEIDLYEMRRAAKMYFTGEKATPIEDAFKPMMPIPRKKKKKVQGGCS